MDQAHCWPPIGRASRPVAPLSEVSQYWPIDAGWLEWSPLSNCRVSPRPRTFLVSATRSGTDTMPALALAVEEWVDGAAAAMPQGTDAERAARSAVAMIARGVFSCSCPQGRATLGEGCDVPCAACSRPGAWPSTEFTLRSRTVRVSRTTLR